MLHIWWSLSVATFSIWFTSKSYAMRLIESSLYNILNLIYIKILCSAFDSIFRWVATFSIWLTSKSYAVHLIVFPWQLPDLIYIKILCSAFGSFPMATFLIWSFAVYLIRLSVATFSVWFTSKSYAVHLVVFPWQHSYFDLMQCLWQRLPVASFSIWFTSKSYAVHLIEFPNLIFIMQCIW